MASKRSVRIACAAAGLFAILVALTVQARRLEGDDFKYLGAFRLEEEWQGEYRTLEYSAGALAYCGSGNGGRGSLFVVGHVYRSLVAEYGIAEPRNGTADSLPVARRLQPLSNVLNGISPLAGNGYIMGMIYVPGVDRIVFSHGSDYSDSDCDPSGHSGAFGWFAPTLNRPQGQGAWLLETDNATLHPFESGRYLIELPRSWAVRHVSNALLASGRHRNWCRRGPGLYAWTPRDAPGGTRLSAQTLMRYGPEGQNIEQGREFAGSDVPKGAVWIDATSSTDAAIVITGLKDWDPARSYYGYEYWQYPAQCEAQGKCKGERGWRAADPRPTLLLYDPADFAAVAHGDKTPGEAQWYAKTDIGQHMRRSYPATYLTTGADAETLAATWDANHRHLYLSETFVDGGLRPIIHVFEVRGAASSSAKGQTR